VQKCRLNKFLWIDTIFYPPFFSLDSIFNGRWGGTGDSIKNTLFKNIVFFNWWIRSICPFKCQKNVFSVEVDNFRGKEYGRHRNQHDNKHQLCWLDAFISLDTSDASKPQVSFRICVTGKGSTILYIYFMKEKNGRPLCYQKPLDLR